MAVYADSLDLRTAVVEAVGTPSFVDVWPRIVQMAELMINRQMRHRRQITSTDLTFTNGVATIPSDFLEVIHLYGQSNREMFEAPLSTVKQSGSMYGYFAIDEDSIHIYGFSGTRTMEYYTTIPTISAALTDTSWVLANFPDVYFAATSLEAAKQLKNTELAAISERMLMAAFESMKIDSDRARFGRAVVRVHGVTP